MQQAPITYKQANRRYVRAFWPVIILYCVLCFAGPVVLKALDDPPKWAWGVVAVLTALPLLGVFALMARYLRETDEYTRKLQVEALLTGGAVTLSASIVWGFLELYQVVPSIWAFWFGPFFFVAYGLSFCVRRLQARAGEG
jgi:hypothetical protein